MTTSELFRTLFDRWYVTLAGACATLFAALWLYGQAGVYQMQVDVQFIPPPNFVQDATNNPENDLVALAGLVEQEVNPDHERLEPASADVPLAGLGVTRGTMVVLPNEDGQFDYAFRQPMLRVKAVGGTADEVSSLLYERVRAIEVSLDDMQADDGVAPGDRVGTRQVPAIPPVHALAGSPTRAAALAIVLGVGLTCVACVFVDRLLTRHRMRRDRRGLASRATSS